MVFPRLFCFVLYLLWIGYPDLVTSSLCLLKFVKIMFATLQEWCQTLRPLTNPPPVNSLHASIHNHRHSQSSSLHIIAYGASWRGGGDLTWGKASVQPLQYQYIINNKLVTLNVTVMTNSIYFKWFHIKQTSLKQGHQRQSPKLSSQWLEIQTGHKSKFLNGECQKIRIDHF